MEDRQIESDRQRVGLTPNEEAVWGQLDNKQKRALLDVAIAEKKQKEAEETLNRQFAFQPLQKNPTLERLAFTQPRQQQPNYFASNQ